jgi:hypothetical protein
MVKLKSLKLANAVKCGTKEELFLSDRDYDMELHNAMVIKITALQVRQTTYTTLMNTVWWMQAEEAEAPAAQVSTGDNRKQPVKARVDA